MDIVIGLLVLILGAGVATMGLRLWFWMLPILGAMIGFFLGAILVTGLVGDGVLATALSWIVGIIVGLAFAAISWLWWYVGAIIAAGAAGASLATAVVATFGVENQWVMLLVGIVAAAIFALGALMFALPLYIVIINTAIAGGLAVVTGLLLIFGQVDTDELGSGHAVAIINDSIAWWLLWIVATAIGIIVQTRGMAVIALPEERFARTTSAVGPQ